MIWFFLCEISAYQAGGVQSWMVQVQELCVVMAQGLHEQRSQQTIRKPRESHILREKAKRGGKMGSGRKHSQTHFELAGHLGHGQMAPILEFKSLKSGFRKF